MTGHADTFLRAHIRVRARGMKRDREALSILRAKIIQNRTTTSALCRGFLLCKQKTPVVVILTRKGR